MEKSRGVANYAIRYNSDPRLVTGSNHMSDDIYLIDVDEMNFDHLCDALNFLCQCTSSITKIQDIVPELKSMKKKYKYLLQERNVKVQHQVTCNADTEIHDYDLDWS